MPKRAHSICVLLLSIFAFLAVSCGDDTSNENSTDTSSSSGGDVASSSSGGDMASSSSGDMSTSSSGTTGIENVTFPEGVWLTESPGLIDEFPDCINDCPNSAATEEGTPIDPKELRTFVQMYDGFAGIIDNNCHSILRDGKISSGPDTDVFTLVSSARTVVELTFQPTTDKFQPVLYSLDGTRLMTFAAAANPGEPARTRFAVPISNLPFFIIVDDAVNNNLFDTQDGIFLDCNSFAGGPDYGYTLSVDTYAFTPTEVAAPTTITGDALDQQGDVKYYRFYANWDDSPQVTVTRTGSATAFQPTIVALNTISGQLAWETIRHDGTGINGDLSLDGTVESIGGFRACHTSDAECQTDTAEFIFAVTDWNGGGGEDYTYDVTINWNQ